MKYREKLRSQNILKEKKRKDHNLNKKKRPVEINFFILFSIISYE